MPYFDAGSTYKSILVAPGSLTYLLGSRAADGGKMVLTSVAIASNVATVGVTGWSGPLPVVGTPITIRGSQTASGAFNVSNVAVSAATLDSSGTGTLSFALTHADISTTADTGSLTFPPQVTGETAVAAATIAGALARPSGARSQNAVFAQLTQPSTGVSALTATAQVSEDNVNWVTRTEVLTIAGSAITAGSVYFETTALFVRFLLSGLTGSGPVAIAVSI